MKFFKNFILVLWLGWCLVVSVSHALLDDASPSPLSQKYDREKRSEDSADLIKKHRKLQLQNEQEEKEKQKLESASKNKDGNTDGNPEKGDAETTQNLFTDAKYETFAPQDDFKFGDF